MIALLSREQPSGLGIVQSIFLIEESDRPKRISWEPDYRRMDRAEDQGPKAAFSGQSSPEMRVLF
jgi:hypothetical protein